MEDEIANLQSQIAAYESSDAKDADTLESYQNLIAYYKAAAEDNETAAMAALEKVDGDLLTGDAKKTYEALSEKLKEEKLSDYYSTGKSALSKKNYATAIENFEAAVEIDEEYKNGDLIYSLAQAYRLNGNTKKAISAYEKVIDLFDGTSIARYSQNYIDSLNKELSDKEDDELEGQDNSNSGTTTSTGSTNEE